MTWNLAIIAFVITAAIADWRWRKIPRVLTVSGCLAGFIFQEYRGYLGSALLAALLAFVIGLALFSLGAIGGGDVKLITALGAMMGVHSWALAMEFAIFAAALMAIIQIIRKGAVWQVLLNISELVRHLFNKGFKPHPIVNVKNAAMIRSPFGVAAAIGTIISVLTSGVRL